MKGGGFEICIFEKQENVNLNPSPKEDCWKNMEVEFKQAGKMEFAAAF